MELKPDEKQTYYINTFEKKINEYAEYLEKQDFYNLKNLGHKLKGSGKAFGFKEISDIGKLIEKSALNRNFDFLKREYEALKELFNKIKLKYGL